MADLFTDSVRFTLGVFCGLTAPIMLLAGPDDPQQSEWFEQGDAALAALGLDDLDAAVERMHEVLEHPNPARSSRGSMLRVRHALEAALTPDKVQS